MKKSTKFFFLAVAVNIILSIVATFTTSLREVRVVDLATLYATAFGAGASLAGVVMSLRNEKTKQVANDQTEIK